MKLPFLALGLGLTVALAGCGGSPASVVDGAQTAKIFDTLKADEVHWNADWKSGDAAKIAAHYAPKAKLMAPGEPMIEGTEAITATVQKMLDTPGFGLTFASDKIHVAKSGELAIARGTYQQTASDPADSRAGSFMIFYQRQADGGWKAQWDIMTPGPSPASPSAP